MQAHEDVRKLVKQDAESQHGRNSQFTFFGSQLCRKLPNGEEQCATIALEARDLFQTMQSLGFFCILPHDPAKTYIRCEKVPS